MDDSAAVNDRGVHPELWAPAKCSQCKSKIWNSAGGESRCRRCVLGLPAPVAPICTICFDDSDNAAALHRCAPQSFESWSSRPCTHRFCMDCMKSYIGSKLDDQVWNVKCPAVDCRYFLNQFDVERFAGSAELQRYQKLRNTDFSSRLVEVLGGQDDEFAKWAKTNTQACPRCHLMCEKSEGCNSMVCRCGTNFCYKCGGESCICGEQHHIIPADGPQLATWHVRSGAVRVPSVAASA